MDRGSPLCRRDIGTVISYLGRNHRVRVCLAVKGVPAEGSLPEPGPGPRSDPSL
jgi:hypothetical protein